MLEIALSQRTPTFKETIQKRNFGYPLFVYLGIVAFPVELRKIESLVEEHEKKILEVWRDYFDIS